MLTNDEVRHQNLLLLVGQAGSQSAVASRLEVTPGYVSDLVKRKETRNGTPRGIGDELARKMEEKFDLERGWMDHQHTPSEGLELQLLTLFRKLSPEAQNKVLLEANFLHNREHPGVSAANPFPNADRHSKV